jgi:indole-3-glycerol phosphate synthase
MSSTRRAAGDGPAQAAGTAARGAPAGAAAERGTQSARPPAGTGMYLDRILPSVLHRLEARKRQVPPERLEALPTPLRPSFVAALRAPGISLIAEVKRASPSKGPIRPELEVGPLVQAYEAAGARAISVLTEQDHFLGSPEDLRAAVAVTGLPVLRKDFILDGYQIHEARAWGASAVLLIAALLSDAALDRLTGLALDLGLDVLLEVHDRQEMTRTLRLKGAAPERLVIGVNNRDLRTFAVSLETTMDLAGLVPPDRLLVSESGIWTHADVERLAARGVDGLLVGESLLREPDVGAAVRGLMRPLPPVVQRSMVHVERGEAR